MKLTRETETGRIEASTNDNTNKEKNIQPDSSGILTEIYTGRNQESTNTVISMAEKGKIEYHRVNVTAMQSDAEESKAKNSNSTDKGNDNNTPHSQEGEQSNQKSKRKRKKKKSGKSNPATSEKETLPSAEDVKPKLGPLMQQLVKQRISEIEPRAFDPKDYTYGGKITYKKLQEKNTSNSGGNFSECSPKGTGTYPCTGTYQGMKIVAVKPITFDIASPENTSTNVVSAGGLQASVNHHQNKVQVGQKLKVNVQSTSGYPPTIQSSGKEARNQIEYTTEQRRKVESYFRDIIIEKRSDEISGKGTWEAKSLGGAGYDGRLLTKDIHNKMPGNDNKSHISIKPYVHVMDKSTQTDPVQEIPSSSENLESINTLTPNSDSESIVMVAESGTTLPPDARNIGNVSKEIDRHTNLNTEVGSLQSITEKFKSINISTLNSGSECTVIADESGATISPEQSDLENFSEEIDNYTYLSTEDESLQSIKEDFLRDVKIASEKFEKNRMKCFKESPNAESTSRKLKDAVNKDICNTIERCGIEHRNILEAFSNVDKDSVVVLDVTDSFSQNCSTMCGRLIKEYLQISAKVDLLLVKGIKNLSAEEWDIRMSKVLTLDDELGYVSAKLIKTMNDWVKQFRDFEKNIGQSITGSQDLYHMGILEISVQLVCILLDFINDKQLQLENYENALRLKRDDGIIV